MKHRYCLAVVASAGLMTALGARSEASTQNSAERCKGPEYRQFDFWIGDWEVRDNEGKMQGKNLVTSEQSGCVVIEHWDSGAQTGTSLSMYDYRTKDWHQSWIDNFGNMLMMKGRVENGSMVMAGKRAMPDGKMALERTRWTPLPDGRVRQVWDYSLDEGKKWTLRFDGFYSRKK